MDKLISQLLANGIYLSVEHERLKIRYDGNSMSEDLLEQVKKNKAELITYLTSKGSHTDYQDIQPLQDKGPFKLSSAQMRLWVLSQFEGGSEAYNIPGSTFLNQYIDVENFKKAINATIDRHEILRTVFRQDATGEVNQWVLDREELGFSIDYQDFREARNKKEKTDEYIAADSYRPFDLAKGPLLRAALLHVADKEYIFYFNMHHIISDGWSMKVLANDVFRYYESYQVGQESKIKGLRIQYKDYSTWQLALLENDAFKKHKEYWLDKLSGELPLIDLGVAKQRPKVKTYNGQRLATYLDQSTTGKLKGYVQEKGGSLFMALLASWNVLMYRYTGQRDIIIGTTVAGRNHADLEDQIGFYVNTLAFRNVVDPDESFDSFYQTLKQDTLKSYTHQMYPFIKLVEDLNLRTDPGRNAIFDVLLDFDNLGDWADGQTLFKKDINEIVDRGYRTAKFDIEASFQDNGECLLFQITYNTDIYDYSVIEDLIVHYKQLLNALLETPKKKISTVDYLSQDERHKLLVVYNDTAVEFPRDKTVVDLFEEQASETPNKIALDFSGKKMTYRDLNEKSNRLAAYLQQNYHIQPNDLVGIYLDRSEWMIISILGILKAGGAYVPIDPEYPSSRKQYIVNDASLALLITETNFIYDIDYYHGKMLAIDVEFSSENGTSEKLPKSCASANIAYVMYTSGSTGVPKGVVVDHTSLTNYLIWAQLKYGDGSGPLNFGWFTSLSFDLTVTSIYLPLITGGEINIFNSTSDVSTTVKEYFNKGIDYIKLTPAHISLLGQLGLESTSVRVAIVGGDKLETAHVDILRGLNPSIRIYNEYGPTESTVGCCIKEIGFEKEPILIGCPIANTQIYIVNERERLQPIKVVGEICISGEGLAEGYLNRPELTAEKFVRNPFAHGKLMYKTGDLGRWLPDGNIEFIGRSDDQVKIRGHRVELGEIEHALLNYEGIDQAVVLVKTDSLAEKELVAYITSNAQQSASNLRSYLKQMLPDYMVPTHFAQLETMPLTVNGKIDKKSLSNLKSIGLTTGVEYVAPRNEIEDKLVKIWEEVLQRENIGVKDDFFALGGHSLKALKVVFRVNEEFKIGVKIANLFNTSSIENLAILIAVALNKKQNKMKGKEIEL